MKVVVTTEDFLAGIADLVDFSVDIEIVDDAGVLVGTVIRELEPLPCDCDEDRTDQSLPTTG